MRIFINLIAILFSVILIYFSIFLYFDISRLQATLKQINNSPTLGKSSEQQDFNRSQIDNDDFRFLSWDSEVNYILALTNSNFSTSIDNFGQRQIAVSKAQNFNERVLKFTPRNINAIIGNLSVLIDQGAPLEYFLPKLDKLIELIPKDQDLKADVAMLCFKLGVTNKDSLGQRKLIDKLNQLFSYSMDYRGMTQVRRYAKLFEQTELLAQVKTNVKN